MVEQDPINFYENNFKSNEAEIGSDKKENNDNATLEINNNLKLKSNLNDNFNGEADCFMDEVQDENDCYDENIELKEIKNDFKGYIMNFGDGNTNVFKDFSQSTLLWKTMLKKTKEKKNANFKIEEQQIQKIPAFKHDRLFEFNKNLNINKKEIFIKEYKSKAINNEKIFLNKKRKTLPLFQIDPTMYVFFLFI